MTNIKKTDRKERLRQPDEGRLKSVLMDDLKAIWSDMGHFQFFSDGYPDAIIGYKEHGIPG